MLCLLSILNFHKFLKQIYELNILYYCCPLTRLGQCVIDSNLFRLLDNVHTKTTRSWINSRENTLTFERVLKVNPNQNLSHVGSNTKKYYIILKGGIIRKLRRKICAFSSHFLHTSSPPHDTTPWLRAKTLLGTLVAGRHTFSSSAPTKHAV